MKNKVIFDILLNLIICMTISFCINSPVKAQSMKLVIGQYECTSNTPCNNGYCDIETHKCVTHFCPETEENTCPDVSDCEAGWSVVNNVCKECTSDDECSGDKPQCVSNQCVACPTNRPVWNGEYCDCPDGEINVDGTCMKCISSKDCPTDKPVCNATSHKCESCPTEKPNWNGEYCDCQEGYYSIKGECLQLRECFSNKNCAMPKPVCNLDEGLCEACPTTSPIWDDEKCVQCLNNTNCSGYELTPACDLTDNRCKSCENIDSNKPYFFNNECVQCTQNTNCAGRSDGKILCQENTCVCPDGQEWDETKGVCYNAACKKAMLNAGFSEQVFSVVGNTITFPGTEFYPQPSNTTLDVSSCDLNFPSNGQVIVFKATVKAKKLYFAGNGKIGKYQAGVTYVYGDVIAEGDVRVHWATVYGTARSKKAHFDNWGYVDGQIYYCTTYLADSGSRQKSSTIHKECQY